METLQLFFYPIVLTIAVLLMILRRIRRKKKKKPHYQHLSGYDDGVIG